MPREATISYDQAVAHAEALKNAGVKPSARLIRERHGSGSLGTVTKLFQKWSLSQARHIETTNALPPTIQRTILDFVSQESMITRADLEERLNEAHGVAADLATENERQAAQLDLLQIQIEELNKENASLDGRIEQMGSDLAEARNEAVRERQAAESARMDLAKALLRLEHMLRLDADLAAAREECHAVDQRRQEVERDLAVTCSELMSAEQSRIDSVQSISARLSDAQEQMRQMTAQTEEARDSLLRTTEQLAVAQSVRADEGAKAAERIGKLEGALAAIEKHFANFRLPVGIQDATNSLVRPE